MEYERQPLETQRGGRPKMKIRLIKDIYSPLGRLTYIDVTGVWLKHPGDPDRCRGNGEHKTFFGKPIECCCEECDYGLECYEKMQKAGAFNE